MKQVSGRELARAVEAKGWILARVHASHHIFIITGPSGKNCHPVHANRPLEIGLLRSLMKIADLQESDL